jgi:hypothetical protein
MGQTVASPAHTGDGSLKEYCLCRGSAVMNVWSVRRGELLAGSDRGHPFGEEEKKYEKHPPLSDEERRQADEALESLALFFEEENKRKKERYARKKREGKPLGGDSFFVRFTEGMPVDDDHLDALWDQNKIAVYVWDDNKFPDSISYRWQDYKGADQRSVGAFSQLSRSGGYVWFESRTQEMAKVGVVRPDTGIEIERSGRNGSETLLRTLQLHDAREVPPEEAPSLRAARPLQAICRWRQNDTRLVALVKGEPVRREWDVMSTEMRNTLCAEYLRLHEVSGYPRLHLLLSSVIAVPRHVDLRGIEEDGTEIFAQIAFGDREDPYVREKVRRLKEYAGSGNKLVCFCECSASQDDGILFIPVREVLEWFKGHPIYGKKLFSV